MSVAAADFGTEEQLFSRGETELCKKEIAEILERLIAGDSRVGNRLINYRWYERESLAPAPSAENSQRPRQKRAARQTT